MDNIPEPVPLPVSTRISNLEGERFGRLTVLYYCGNDKHRFAQWVCVCDCGNATIVITNNLRSGNTGSCGCLKWERRLEAITTHGRTGTPEWVAWHAMRRRCYDPGQVGYRNYGARGITVCDRWINSFENFFADMGLRPTPKHSIHRIDNDKGYSPKNCRWATRQEQSDNRRATKRLTYKGVTKTIKEWALELEVPYGRLQMRTYLGWTAEQTLETPKNHRRKPPSPSQPNLFP